MHTHTSACSLRQPGGLVLSLDANGLPIGAESDRTAGRSNARAGRHSPVRMQARGLEFLKLKRSLCHGATPNWPAAQRPGPGKYVLSFFHSF